MKHFLYLLAISFLAQACQSTTEPEATAERPNILLVLVDDMGYSDLGCYGAEIIQTPNLDQLAEEGLRFTQFYNSARCCPTRASLLTGLYPHQVGFGKMVTSKPYNEVDSGAYQGYLSDNSVTLAEVLREAGYYTAMSGKWHVGERQPQWPIDRGFEDYYGLVSGAMNFFDITKGKPGAERVFLEEGQRIVPQGDGFYATDAFTTKAVDFLAKAEQQDNPFFLYLAYNAPHYPLHAWPEDIAKYEGKFMMGWDSLRQLRFENMKALGIIAEDSKLSPRDTVAPAWETIDDKAGMDLKMAIYAAQMESMDRGLGQVLDKIEAMGEKDNTLVLFLSDNGACAETSALGGDWMNNGNPPGGVDSYQSYGLCWANASNTPLKYYKQDAHEGGTATPFIVRWPAQIKRSGAIVQDVGHITDIMTTFVEIANANYPTEFNGNAIPPMEGRSLLPIFQGEARAMEEPLFWEHFGNRGVRQGDWKLVARKGEPWQLFDLSTDRIEQHDLSAEHPEKAAELEQLYDAWAKRVGV